MYIDGCKTEIWLQTDSLLFLSQIANSFICSGDGDGKAYIWDWKTTKLLSKWKAHDDVCIQVSSSDIWAKILSARPKKIQTNCHMQVLWHPHEASKVATAGWDGVVKFWDWDEILVFIRRSFVKKKGCLLELSQYWPFNHSVNLSCHEHRLKICIPLQPWRAGQKIVLRFFIVQHLLSLWQQKVPVSLNATQLFQSYLGYTQRKGT